MNKYSKSLNIVFVIIGVLALVCGFLLKENLLLGAGFLFLLLAVLLWGQARWFDELRPERKVWVSVVLAVGGAVMIVLVSKDWDPTILSPRLIGDALLLLAGMTFFFLGLIFSAISIRGLSERMEGE